MGVRNLRRKITTIFRNLVIGRKTVTSPKLFASLGIVGGALKSGGTLCQEIYMAKSCKTTSDKVAKQAAKVLSDPKSTPTDKQIAGSALGQKEKK